MGAYVGGMPPIPTDTWGEAEMASQVRRGHGPWSALAEMAEVLKVHESRLELLARVAEFFPQEERFGQLSFAHHLEAMRLAPNAAHIWLGKADAERWNSKELRLAIRGDGDPAKYSWLRMGTYWYFSECDPRFGVEHPGRVPGQIAANTIYYFTDPGDLVIDPMAGGGSTLDAAHYLERQCNAFDLTPVRSDIQQLNSLQSWPVERRKARLVFLDPPYGTVAKGFYAGDASLGNLSEEQFLSSIAILADHSARALRADGHLAILMQNVWGWSGDTVFRITHQLLQAGWKLDRRIQVPISNQQISSGVMKWARENRQLVNTDRDLVIFSPPSQLPRGRPRTRV